jgi:flagellar export protein FliJ
MKLLHSLNRLVDLRALEVDRLQAEMAGKESVRQRYCGTLARLDALCAGSGASGGIANNGLPLAAALNCGAYKQAVMQLADAHRANLSLHEADMAVTQRALVAAAQRHEVLGQVAARHLERGLRVEQVREQKRQDELATQVWVRGLR